MKKLIIIPSIFILITGCGFFKKSSYRSDAEPISHEIWSTILTNNVSAEGWFDYKNIQADRDQFDLNLSLLRNQQPNPDTWSRNQRMAYWINA